MVDPRFDVQKQLRINELVGKQRIVIVRKHRLQPHSARIGIDLIVHRQKGPRGEHPFVLPIECLDGQPISGFKLVHHGGQIILGDGKDDRDGLELRDHEEAAGIVERTMLPGSTRRNPTRPSMGAVMLQYVSCSFALSIIP